MEDSHTIADETTPENSSGEKSNVRALLIVYDASRPDMEKRLVEIPDGGEVSFGRSRSCTVTIQSERVSRKHARVLRFGRNLVVEDTGSRNGTRLNGKKIKGASLLSAGDEIAIGPATAVVSVTTSGPRLPRAATVSRLKDRLAAEADRALRFRRPFALVVLRFDGSPDGVGRAVDRISGSLRPMDMLAENDSQEYAVLLPEVDQTTAPQEAQRLVAEIHHPSVGPVSVQVGMALFPDHGTSGEALLQEARAALANAVAEAPPSSYLAALPEEPAPLDANIVATDPQTRRIFALVHKVANYSMTVLIRGETGVGKELVAEELHRASDRRNDKFVRLNCASIHESLLESELFGYERGAFTGADRRKIGYIESANGGTLFLDEIGEMSVGVQAKLLRVLEDRKLSRVGGVDEIRVDVRVVCATNRDLDEEVKKGAFREDLFFRISAFTIVVPPLRDRPDEIPLLTQHFVERVSRDTGIATPAFSSEAMRALRQYSWPGNVRELRNAIERAVVLHQGGVIGLEHLPEVVRNPDCSPIASARPSADMRNRLAHFERSAIVSALEETGGNQTRAAQRLGVSRRALIYKLEKYGLKAQPRRKRETPDVFGEADAADPEEFCDADASNADEG